MVSQELERRRAMRRPWDEDAFSGSRDIMAAILLGYTGSALLIIILFLSLSDSGEGMILAGAIFAVPAFLTGTLAVVVSCFHRVHCCLVTSLCAVTAGVIGVTYGVYASYCASRGTLAFPWPWVQRLGVQTMSWVCLCLGFQVVSTLVFIHLRRYWALALQVAWYFCLFFLGPHYLSYWKHFMD